MNDRIIHLHSRVKQKTRWLGHRNKAQNALKQAAVTSINLGCDHNFTVLKDHKQFWSHILYHPPLESSYRSRLFSYSTHIPMSQLLAINDDFKFANVGSHPAGMDTYDGTQQPDYETKLCDTCSCSICASPNECGRVVLTANFGILEAQTKEDWARGEDKQLDEVRQKPSEYLYAGSQIKFPGATAGVITFGLRLAKFRIICYKDGQQLRRLEAFHYGSKILEVMHEEPIDYVIAQIKELEACWNDTIRKCKSVLADVNRGVLEESFGEIDRKLVRGLYKYAQTWEELRRVHTQQVDAFQHLMQGGAQGIWFRINQAAEPERENDRYENVRVLVESFNMIEAKIKKDLVEETSELISRTHSIISIDEAYRSRDQNESVKRLSWITFIFLPLLFVASLFGMNVDLVENNPSWIYYIYISIPMFLLLLLSVWILKQLKGFTRAVSGWVDGTRNKYTTVLSQRMGNDEETKCESNRENTTGLDYAAAIGDATAVRRAVIEIGDAKRLCVNALRLAAGGGHQEVVEYLLDNGADIEGGARTAGRTPLQAAAGGGHLSVVEYLLAKGAEVDAGIGHGGVLTALQAAAGGGHLSVVEYLLAKGADFNAEAGPQNGRTALQAAAGGGHLPVVEHLLAKGADVNAEPGEDGGRTALQAAAGGGHLSVVEYFLAKGADFNAEPGPQDGRTALQAAAGGGHLSVVEYFLAKGADVNADPGPQDGLTALQAAADGGHLPVVEYLLAQGAEVNPAPERGHGRTALHAAAACGHLPVVQYLLAQGAEVNAARGRGRGRTALQAAAGGGHLPVVQYLLAQGAEVNAAPGGQKGRTALQDAAGGGHLPVVEYLLARGAEVNAEPGHWHGRTTLQAAAGGGHLDVVKYLVAQGAEVNAAAAIFGYTALYAANRGGHQAIASILRAAGATH